MTFPLVSVSTITPACRRALRVMQRSGVAKLIARAEVFNCRKMSGSSSWSQHAWGNAADLIPRPPSSDDDKQRDAIAHNVVRQATERTIANRGRRLAVEHVIDHDARRIWTRGTGWHTYTRPTGDHVHVDFTPNRTGTPPCA